MFVFVSVLFLCGRLDASCVVTSNSTRQPVFLKNETGEYDFIAPKSDGIHLRKDERLVLLCPGHLNRLTQSDRNISTALCIGGDKFLFEKKVYKFGDLECRHGIRGSVQNTSTVCVNGMISYIGYNIYSQFLRLIEVCYNESMGTTIYTRHTILGRTYNGEFSPKYHRPTFDTKGLSKKNKAISLAYYIAAQKSRLSSLLSSSILANDYVTNKTYLARAHLSPSADFMFVSLQYTTYSFLNVCPQWQAINAGNWKRVENMARKLAKSLQENLQIITGTHEILELPDRYGNMKKLYLSQTDAKFPVPEFVWKVVYSEKSKRAIVVVSYNNPYASSGKFLCSCVCDKYGWSATEWSNIKKGFVQCCKYDQFKSVVRNVPNIQVEGVLQGPV